MTGSWRPDHQLELWDLGSGDDLVPIFWESGSQKTSSDPCQIYAAQFLKTTGNLIMAGGSGSNEVKIFDRAVSMKLTTTITDMSRAVYTIDFANQTNLFSIAGGDGQVHLYKTEKPT